jgi:alanine dehydrogenase
MIIAVPREIKEQEYRVALPPSAAYQLIKRGHRVLVERGAGAGAGFPDSGYAQVGAAILDDSEVLFEEAELIVKVKEPQPSEYARLRPGQMLFTYLHLAANRELTAAAACSSEACRAFCLDAWSFSAAECRV